MQRLEDTRSLICSIITQRKGPIHRTNVGATEVIENLAEAFSMCMKRAIHDLKVQIRTSKVIVHDVVLHTLN